MEDTTQFVADIIGVDEAGYGIAEKDDVSLRIPGVVTGDRAVAEVAHSSAHANVVWCRLVSVSSRGAAFRKPPCPHAWPVNGRCGGCPLMHLEEGAASALKIRRVARAMKSVGIDAPISFHPSPKTSGYRNRGHFIVAGTGGEVVLGAYAPRSHDVVSMSGCRVLRPPMPRVARELAQLMTARRIPVHPRSGGVRYITLRASSNGACLVDVVKGSKGEAHAAGFHSFSKAVLSLKNVIGVSYSINETSGNAMHVSPSTVIVGKDRVVEKVGEIGLAVTAASFSQLNREVMTAMYEEAAGMIPGDVSVIWDLYCGVGGLGLTAAKRYPAARLLSTDIVASAAPLAVENGRRAGVALTFEPMDLTTVFPEKWPHPDVVLLNPPRRGLDRIVREGVIAAMPGTIVYMSCNPKSFGSDARAILDAGYAMDGVSAYDMLPGTAHVEVIAGFRRLPNASG